MNKRALVIIQGINKEKRYMRTKNPVIKDFYKSYDAIEYSDTELVFDRGWFSIFFDKWDFIPYFLNGKKRQAVCRLVNEKVAALQLLGYRVDIVAHSLGAVIAMQCGRKKSPLSINRMILLQSPMHNNIYGGYVRKKIKKYSDGLEVNYMLSTYNKKDKFVASKPVKKFKKFMESLKSIYNKFTQLVAGNGHDWERVLEELIVEGTV